MLEERINVALKGCAWVFETKGYSKTQKRRMGYRRWFRVRHRGEQGSDSRHERGRFWKKKIFILQKGG